MKRRTLMQALVIGLVAPSFARAEKKTKIDVYKTSSCGCCVDWISHLEQNGFEVIAHNVPKTGPYRLRFAYHPTWHRVTQPWLRGTRWKVTYLPKKFVVY